MQRDDANQQVVIGIVGLGYWGPNLLRVLFELEGVRVKWLIDLDRARLRHFKSRYPSVQMTTDIELALADDEVDVMVIATPVHTHFDLAVRCIDAEKHVYVEKPLAPSVEDADDLIAFAEQRDVKLMCGHTFLYSPAVRSVKNMLEQGELGEVFFLSSSRVNLGLHQQDISVVWDLGPHDFSILLHWFDELPVSVRAVGRASIVPGIHDVAFVTLAYASGLVASVELSWLAPSKLRRTVVVGSEKMVVYEDGAPEPVRVFDRGVIYRDPETFGEYHLSYRTGNIISPHLEHYEPLNRQLADFVSAVRGERGLAAQTKLARDVVCLCEAANRSLLSGGGEIMIAGRDSLATPAPVTVG
jgi:predicted dehydrogenase